MVIKLSDDLRVGFNVHAQGTGVKNVPRLEQWCKEGKPSMMLVMDNPGFAQKLRALGVPIVVHRMWTAHSWYDLPVSDWFDAHPHLGDVYQALENERGAPLDYTLAFIRHNNGLAKPHRVCLWNISSGTPEPDEWEQPKLLEIMRLIAQTPGRYAIGVHEYFHNNPWGFLPPAEWPTNLPVDASLYNSHVMRIGQLALLCQKHGIAMPDVLVTEAGTDNHGDLEPTLGKTGRGWKEARELWRKLYPTLSPAEAFYMGLWYAARVMYASLPFVKGMAVFSYGHIVETWNDFDCEDLPDLLALLRDWQTPRLLTQFGVTTTPVPQPVPTPQPQPPMAMWMMALTLGGDYGVKLRQKPNTTSAQLGAALRAGALVTSNDTQVIGETIRPANGAASSYWIPVTVNGAAGYISAAYAQLVAPVVKLTVDESAALTALAERFAEGSPRAKLVAPKLRELLRDVS